jgi:hypothetical protein
MVGMHNYKFPALETHHYNYNFPALETHHYYFVGFELLLCHLYVSDAPVIAVLKLWQLATPLEREIEGVPT